MIVRTPEPGDLPHLRRCVALARHAVKVGDEPFGSLLVLDGDVLFEDFNHVSGGDNTRHPEFAIARWAAENLSADQRRAAVVYTSGEHCPMCAAAHGWVGLGRIVYAAGAIQLLQWRREWGLDDAPVAPLPISAVAPGVVVAGPAPELIDEIRALHARAAGVELD
ncbi:nucleoside deaminase [Gordonia sp. (in: high G+C Gram-positive bacteria)]|uniref:nucleoside deaminase n=1 Tax=unclassified Gordonia (in: high G+C Gram-positive bacteria) TaxID=2657482 RepID=UPI002637A09A|nr:nucleoside deaminase [Gordonia sp. (in: high G+C Gram-positive bacteria)]